MEEKIAWEMFQECVYATEAEAQKITDPEGKNDLYMPDLYMPDLYVSRKEIMEEIKSVNAKVESLVDYISQLVETTTNGLNGIVQVIDKDS